MEASEFTLLSNKVLRQHQEGGVLEASEFTLLSNDLRWIIGGVIGFGGL